MEVYDVCAQIRADAKKAVANKGKKCPGGYWIPKKNECGGKKLSSPEGSDTRRKNRRNLAVGLGVGLGGAALVGAGVTAAASRRGKAEESADKKTADKKTGQEGRAGVSPLKKEVAPRKPDEWDDPPAPTSGSVKKEEKREVSRPQLALPPGKERYSKTASEENRWESLSKSDQDFLVKEELRGAELDLGRVTKGAEKPSPQWDRYIRLRRSYSPDASFADFYVGRPRRSAEEAARSAREQKIDEAVRQELLIRINRMEDRAGDTPSKKARESLSAMKDLLSRLTGEGKKDSLHQGWVPLCWDENYVLYR